MQPFGQRRAYEPSELAEAFLAVNKGPPLNTGRLVSQLEAFVHFESDGQLLQRRFD
jgi:hypothetical protein